MTAVGLWYFGWWSICLHWFYMVHIISVAVLYPVIEYFKGKIRQ